MILRAAAPRKGAVLPLVAILLIPTLAMVAFAVDIGYISVVGKEVQNAADSAALAGAAQLLDRGALQGSPNLTATLAKARDKAQQFAAANTGGNVSLAVNRNDDNDANGDIVCGYLANPSDLSTTMTANTTLVNSVQVRVRRTAQQNGALPLFFGSVLGKSTQDLTAKATATYEGGIRGFQIAGSGATTTKLLPFTVHIDTWKNAINGNGPDVWNFNTNTRTLSKASDGIHEMKLFPQKGTTPGNFGTVDIGGANNSNADTTRQILYGPNQADLDKLGGTCALGEDGTLILQGDTGISAGFKDELEYIRGQPRIIPIYTTVTGQGNNTYFTIVAFGGIIITDVQLTTGNKYVTIQPEYVQDPTAVRGGSSTTSYFVTKPLRITR